MDDFTTTVAIGPASVAYRLCGCYFRILNLPPWFQSHVDYIFLKFLAFSSDVSNNALRLLAVNELLVSFSPICTVKNMILASGE